MRPRLRRMLLALLPLLAVTTATVPARAADWPMWRHDARRSAASPQVLAGTLHLQWTRDYPPLRPAWPDQPKMQLDVAYDPVVAGQSLFVGSSRHDCVRALDTRTGNERWTFFADGPVRFAPVAWQDRLFFTADDGFLYCLDAATGKELWKVRGGAGDRKVLGNERLVSTWPARGAPVVADDTVYFAAGIWPFMGIFVHAVDARTGRVLWTNDGDGSLYIKQPHNADAFAGVAPQGPMVVVGDRLLVPGGRSVPACLDRRTGKLLRFQLAENGKRGGGAEVYARDDVFFNGGAVFDLATQKYLADFGKHLVLTGEAVYAGDGTTCRACDPHPAAAAAEDDDDWWEAATTSKRWALPELGACKVPAVETMIKAGPRLYVGAAGAVAAVDVDAAGKALKVSWQADVEGQVVRLVAADDRLFAVTREGRIYCFGADATPARHHPWLPTPTPAGDLAAQRRAAAVLKAAPSGDGYAVLWGLGDGRLLRELVRQSRLHVIVVEPNADRVQKWRADLTAEDVHGSRVVIVPGRLATVLLPPYLASVAVCEDRGILGGQAMEDFVAQAFQVLRPYGGVLCFDATSAALEKLARAADRLPGARLRTAPGLWVLGRDGALAGAGNWTHEHGDAGNTRCAPDQLVKAPLGLLWFGGPSHEGILPRHGHGPEPQVVDGRLIIEGVDLLRALDVYTGRLLWETALPGVGELYNNLAHQAGANASGGNFVCTADCIYVACKDACIRLDPATGARRGAWTLPPGPDGRPSPRWGYLNVYEDYLVGGAEPNFDPALLPRPAKNNGNDDDRTTGTGGTLTKVLKSLRKLTDNGSASGRLVVLDRHTGKVLWQVSADRGFRHNAICAGGGRLYAIDRVSTEQAARLKLRDEEPPAPRLRVFELRTGKELWSTQDGVFGTWLSYSARHDVLVESGRMTRDSLLDEPRGMRAYRGADGQVLWYAKDYLGPAMIRGDTVLEGQGSCDLLTGAPTLREDPITGLRVPWKWARGYGCNTPAASEHLLTFRSGAAGYFDLCRDGGTGNFGGFRSSCTHNLVVAGGVLTVPDYTRTCVCAYQNQTSVGLVHLPDAEMWTYFGTRELAGPVRRVGLNFGAPGDRRADDGTLWLEYPSTGGVSPAVAVHVQPANAAVFRRHSSAVTGPYPWVASSGLQGVREVAVDLNDPDDADPRSFTVRLVFAEPDDLGPGERVFDVAVQGRLVLKAFDVVRAAGGPRRSVIETIPGVAAHGKLVIRLTPAASASVRRPILCGVEIVADRK